MSAPLGRIEGNYIQTPILAFRHPDTKSQIDAVGMVHVADRSFYDTVIGYTSGREAEGAFVYYEGVKQADAEEVSKAHVETQQLLQSWRDVKVGGASLQARALDLVHHSEVIDYRGNGHWENHDMTDLALIQRMGAASAKKLIHASTRQNELAIPEKVGRLVRFLVRKSLIMATKSLANPDAPRRQAPYEAVTRDERSDFVLQAVGAQLEKDPTSHIVLLWGTQHIPQFTDNLRQRGYSLVDHTWLNAIQLKKPKPRKFTRLSDKADNT